MQTLTINIQDESLTEKVLWMLEHFKAVGAIGGWGASVHSVHGGQVALQAGADMLQVPYSCLQQENLPLLVICGLRRTGVLVQSAVS